MWTTKKISLISNQADVYEGVDLIKIILHYLFNSRKCMHDRITPSNIERFCPDCGKEINISWHIVRCSHCNNKRESFIKLGRTLPTERYCSKCGESHFYVEVKYRVDFFDFRYSTLVKEEIGNHGFRDDQLQVWIDNNQPNKNIYNQKLIPTLVGQ